MYDIKCVKCRNALSTHDTLDFLLCHVCKVKYPIVYGIPILVYDLKSYLAHRNSVGHTMMRLCSGAVREFIAGCMPPDCDDTRGGIERRWAAIYASNSKSPMYDTVSRYMSELSYDSMLEIGCSTGNLLRRIKYGTASTGVDRSFPALTYAQKSLPEARYILADINGGEFGAHDMVAALNILELVEPATLLQFMAAHTTKYMVLADPYDYARGDNTVNVPMNGIEVREYIRDLGFDISRDTAEPSFIPWNIRINSRISMRYKVDIIVAKRR